MTDKQLTSTLRAARPTPSKEEARRLDERFAALLEDNKPKRAKRLSLSPELRPALIPVAAFGCLLLVAGGLVAPNLTSQEESRFDSSKVADSGRAETSSSGDTALTIGPPTPTVTPDKTDSLNGPRQVSRNAALGLRVDDVFAASRRVSGLVAAGGGVVLSSDLNQPAGQGTTSQMRLSVPSDKATLIVTQLAALGQVESRSQTAEDITDNYNESELRLDELRARRASLLRQLSKAESGPQRAVAERQLDLNRQELRRASQEFALIKREASQATISLTLMSESAASDQARANDGRLDISEALGLAGTVLSTVAAYLLLLLVLIAPLALFYLGGLWLRRRRRGY